MTSCGSFLLKTGLYWKCLFKDKTIMDNTSFEGGVTIYKTYFILSLIAGMGVALQAGINLKLRLSLNSALFAALINFAVGTVALIVIFVAAVLGGTQSVPTMTSIRQTNWWMWAGGMLGAFYIFTTIFASQKIGFANMFSLVIAGQIILAVILDHFGLLGNTIHILGPSRIAGVVLLIAGVYFIQTS